MATERCDACRHDVPAGRWCNWCGAALAPEPRATAARGRRMAVAAVLGVAVVGAVGVATVGGDAPRHGVRDTGVVLDEPAARAVPEASVEDTGPRTDVVCSDLRVRSVPSDQLGTTEEGELVELAHGPCVVMGPEGATSP